jgi:hypothetical protein
MTSGTENCGAIDFNCVRFLLSAPLMDCPTGIAQSGLLKVGGQFY